MSKFKEAVSQAGIYVPAFAFTQLLTVAGSLLMRWFLGPLQTGVWALVQVILTYTDYPNLGATYAIPVEIPAKRATGKEEEAEKIKNVIWTFSFFTSVVFAGAVLMYAFWNRDHIRVELFYGLLLAAGLAILQQMNNVLISLLRAHKNFSLAGKQMVLSAVVNLALIAAFSSFFRLYGFMFAMVLSFTFNIAYIFSKCPFRFRLEVDFKVLRGLISYGFPLMALGLLTTFLMTMDQIFIAKNMGVTALGLYSVAIMATGFVNSIPNSAGIVLLPNVSEKFAGTGEAASLRGYLLKSNHLFAVLMPILIGLAWFWAPVAIRLIIPEFEAGVPALKTLTMSAFFFGLTQSYIDFIVVSRKHLWQFPLSLCVCALAFAAYWFTVHRGEGIAAMGIVKTLVFALNFSVLFFFSARLIFSAKEIVREYAAIWGQFLLMAAALFFIDRLFAGWQPFLRAAVQSLFLAAVYFPLVWHADRRYGISVIFREKFFKPKLITPEKF